GLVSGVVTEDTDAIVFGNSPVLRHFFRRKQVDSDERLIHDEDGAETSSTGVESDEVKEDTPAPDGPVSLENNPFSTSDNNQLSAEADISAFASPVNTHQSHGHSNSSNANQPVATEGLKRTMFTDILHIDPRLVLEGLGLDRRAFIDVCILCGTDFSPKIPGIGPVNALKLIKKHGSIENAIPHLKKPPPADFDPEAARHVFTTAPQAAEDSVGVSVGGAVGVNGNLRNEVVHPQVDSDERLIHDEDGAETSSTGVESDEVKEDTPAPDGPVSLENNPFSTSDNNQLSAEADISAFASPVNTHQSHGHSNSISANQPVATEGLKRTMFTDILHIDPRLVLEGLGLDRRAFIDVCILCGTDFSPKIPGIGPVNALKLIKKHGSIENAIPHLKKPPPADFDPEAARHVFTTAPQVDADVLAQIKNLLDTTSHNNNNNIGNNTN
ncbi:hypothetical protein GQ42DRAFT_172870, partial [Ramicandelaber brevisporus]